MMCEPADLNDQRTIDVTIASLGAPSAITPDVRRPKSWAKSRHSLGLTLPSKPGPILSSAAGLRPWRIQTVPIKIIATPVKLLTIRITVLNGLHIDPAPVNLSAPIQGQRSLSIQPEFYGPLADRDSS
jgi:hypothetical protein